MANTDEDAVQSSPFATDSVHRQTRSKSGSTNSPNTSPLLPAADADSDSDGEAADFRFLSSLTPAGSKKAQGLPKRGTKDFEPNPTVSQRSTLHASRKAMHDALSVTRVHAAGKGHNMGVFVNWDRYDEAQLWSGFRGMDSGEWRKRCCVVYQFKGTHSKTVGRNDRRGWTWLLPEEALYLIERGSLDVRWPAVGEVALSLEEGADTDEVFEAASGHHVVCEKDEKQGYESVEELRNDEDREQPPPIAELPMSLQGAYASFIGKSGLTLDRYIVYAGLKRSGYIVQRAPTWNDEDDVRVNGYPHSSIPMNSPSRTPSPQIQSSQPSLLHRLLSYILNPRRGTENSCLGPLLAPGLYRNYNDIFRSLALIPYHTSLRAPASVHSTPQNPMPSPFSITYNLYKPSSAASYRKSAPPSPDYRVCVVDARTTSVPTVGQIGDLLDAMPEDELGNEKRGIEARIKHGTRNVLVAVVDAGVVSYLRFAESEIGRYKLFEEKGRRGGGKGRRGKGGSGGRGGKRGG